MNSELTEIIKEAVAKKATDIHLTEGKAPVYRINGNLSVTQGDVLSSEKINSYIQEISGDDKYREYIENGQADLSISVPSIARIRINVYRQKNSGAIAIRLLSERIPELASLNLPPVLEGLSSLREGLLLVTGTTGSGKSTTVAALINEINKTRSEHILTLEDPIEYIHSHKKSLISQREIIQDTLSYSIALRAAMREDPDIIFVGEMRDLETISTAITAAETGHLVISTLHTLGAANTVDRLIDVFPPYQQQQIRAQVSMVLKAVVSQRLIPSSEGKGLFPAVEYMLVTPAISNLIRENKTSGLDNVILTGGQYGMIPLDKSIAGLYKRGFITLDDARKYCRDKESLERFANSMN